MECSYCFTEIGQSRKIRQSDKSWYKIHFLNLKIEFKEKVNSQLNADIFEYSNPSSFANKIAFQVDSSENYKVRMIVINPLSGCFEPENLRYAL